MRKLQEVQKTRKTRVQIAKKNCNVNVGEIMAFEPNWRTKRVGGNIHFSIGHRFDRYPRLKLVDHRAETFVAWDIWERDSIPDNRRKVEETVNKPAKVLVKKSKAGVVEIHLYEVHPLSSQPTWLLNIEYFMEGLNLNGEFNVLTRAPWAREIDVSCRQGFSDTIRVTLTNSRKMEIVEVDGYGSAPTWVEKYQVKLSNHRTVIFE